MSDTIVMCNHCKAIYRFLPSLCDCIEGDQKQSYSEWHIVPKIPTREIIAAARNMNIISGYDGMDEPTYTSLSDFEARDIYARIIAAAQENNHDLQN